MPYFPYRRQGIEEALKQVDGSGETVVNTLREYVVMNSTLKSILQKVQSFYVSLLAVSFDFSFARKILGHCFLLSVHNRAVDYSVIS